MYLADSLHLFGSLDSLGVVNNKHALFASFLVEFFEHPFGIHLNDSHFIKAASPEKFAVIGSVCAVAEKINQPLYGTAMTDADSHYKIAIIGINVSRKSVSCRPEKRLDFFRNFADSNHTASLRISTAIQNTYRQDRLFLFNHLYHQNSFNRSV
jgi:hypothetical protein